MRAHLGWTPTLTPAPLPALPHQSHCHPCPMHCGDSACDALRPPPSPGPHPWRPLCHQSCCSFISMSDTRMFFSADSLGLEVVRL